LNFLKFAGLQTDLLPEIGSVLLKIFGYMKALFTIALN